MEGMPIVRFTGDDMTDTIVRCLEPLVGLCVALNGQPIEVTKVDHYGIQGYVLDSEDWIMHDPTNPVRVACSWIVGLDIEVP